MNFALIFICAVMKIGMNIEWYFNFNLWWYMPYHGIIFFLHFLCLKNICVEQDESYWHIITITDEKEYLTFCNIIDFSSV